jgi:PP-loop superfamily ATP-utilizing enzyme
VVRVRHDRGAARVEVGAGEVARLAERWGGLAPRLAELGFARVEYDPDGYRQGGADRPRGPTDTGKAQARPDAAVQAACAVTA